MQQEQDPALKAKLEHERFVEELQKLKIDQTIFENSETEGKKIFKIGWGKLPDGKPYSYVVRDENSQPIVKSDADQTLVKKYEAFKQRIEELKRLLENSTKN
jgi:hypothetical protein